LAFEVDVLGGAAAAVLPNRLSADRASGAIDVQDFSQERHAIVLKKPSVLQQVCQQITGRNSSRFLPATRT